MSEKKTCIACAEEIMAAAKLCKHCGTVQDDPAFNDDLKANLVPHVCDHNQTLSQFAETQTGNFWGGPKLKPLVEDHGGEKIVAIIPKVKYSFEGIFEEMMIVTESSLLFAGYGTVGKVASYPLTGIKALWISDADIGMGVDTMVGLVMDFEAIGQEVELRVIPLGTNPNKARQVLSQLGPIFEQIGGHLPVGHTGETVVGGYTTTFGVGFGFFREI